MSTKMEDDWAHTLAVCRACLPRRGRKAEDDRRFLEALHFFNHRECSLARSAGALRSLEQRVETFRSAEQGRRFRSLLRRARVHELHGASPSDVRLHRRARACVGGRSKGGQEGQALGRSRGGFTTKIHAKSDASGDIIAFDLTGVEVSDARHFDILLDIGPDIQPRAVVCDKGYASNANREVARARGIAPVIPHKANERENQPSSPGPSTKRAYASNRASDTSSASNASRTKDDGASAKRRCRPSLTRRRLRRRK